MNMQLRKNNRILAQVRIYSLTIPILTELATRGYSLEPRGTGYRRK